MCRGEGYTHTLSTVGTLLTCLRRYPSVHTLSAHPSVLTHPLLLSPQGTVSVHAVADAAARNVIITISDSGCGIPQQEMANLLVPFNQVGRRQQLHCSPIRPLLVASASAAVLMSSSPAI